MKIIEPLSSALLITGCAYAAGIAQNSALMRVFGINPTFSQPAIDKIFYDGGLVTFETFIRHIFTFSVVFTVITTLLILTILIASKFRKFKTKDVVINLLKSCKRIMGYKTFGSAGALAYLIILTFSTYDTAQKDGENIAKAFINTCHAVLLKKGKDTTFGCAFSKDRDSIWYYTIEGDSPKANSKPLSDLDQITYLDPIKLD